MKQAYQHLEKGCTYYNLINDKIQDLVKRWNLSHVKQTDPKVIGEIFKTIFKYHHWIKVDDIEPAIDLGLMGEFGENKGLNSETIFNWFKVLSKRTRENEIKEHSAYQHEKTFISMEQRAETRASLIQTFMNFYDEYKKTKVYNSDMDHYLPVFYRWFKRLGYIIIDKETENKIQTDEALLLRDMRGFFMQKKNKENRRTQKGIFIEAFIIAAENDYPIYNQLKQMNL